MKKIITIAATVLLVAVMTVSSSIYSYAQVKGDVNDDGGSDNKDVVALFRYVSAGIKAEDESVYDFNGDGVVDNKDVVDLFRDLCVENASETAEVTTGPEETAEETTETENHRYNILLYACGEGAAFGAVDGQYNGEKFFGFAETSQKEGMPRKTVEMFGAQHSMSYTDTAYFKIYDHKYDTYMGKNDGLFMFDENTGALVTYSCLSDENAPGYTPPVNAHSSRQDFIDYASALLLEYTGTSTEDCDVSFRTLYLKTTYRYTREEINQEFVNFIDQDPNFSAEYEITFRRKFSEVYRVDDISAIIRSDGTVLNLKCRTSDEKYEPFNDVQIDAESLTNQIKKLSYKPYYYSYNILLTAIPDGNKLWIMADVNYKYEVDGELFGSAIQYITKVAEIPSDQTEPDPVDTEFETWDAYAGTEAE